jgi:hypothetical protein
MEIWEDLAIIAWTELLLDSFDILTAVNGR